MMDRVEFLPVDCGIDNKPRIIILSKSILYEWMKEVVVLVVFRGRTLIRIYIQQHHVYNNKVAISKHMYVAGQSSLFLKRNHLSFQWTNVL